MHFYFESGKGSTADISIDLVGEETRANWKSVEVLAGEPHRMTISSSGQAVSLEQGNVQLDVTVYDQHNNLVEDDTEIDYLFSDGLLVVEKQLLTVNGRARIVLTGGEFAIDDTIVTVQSGGASAEEHISIEGLNVEVSASATTLDKLQTVTVSALVTRQDGTPVADVPVSFSADKGMFSSNDELTDGSGIAQVQYTAGLNEITDTWYAQVGYVGIGELAFSVQSDGDSDINALDAMLVADESVAGSVTYDEHGINHVIGYETTGTLDVRTAAAGTVTIGDLADPNLEPLISLPMHELETVNGNSVFQDEHELNPASVSNVTIVRDHPLGAGRSAQLTQLSQISIDANALFDLTQDIGFRLDIKPTGNGTIFDHATGAQRLTYSGDTLTLTVTTDSGVFTQQAPNVSAGSWHRVATRVTVDSLELYVDGVVYSQPITGSLDYGGSSGIQIGGIAAVMRSFRLYDWSSQPLITFADGSTELAVSAGSQTLSVRSLGNLGTLQSGSQLRTLRVAVMTGDQRNYVSLLTKYGYQEIARQHLRTISPESPYAYYNVPNPIPGLVPTAYAWTWDGVWDSVKTTVSYLIPYEDFITIGEQLVYLMNRDWENFSPTKLAFASLGAATVLPPAKALKPLLGPAKRFVDAFARFPAAKHFAGAVGTAVKSGLSGKTDKITNLMPFILIGLELYEDPEVFEFIMNAISSEEDLWTWVEYIAHVVGLEGGLDELAASDTAVLRANSLYAKNPAPWLVPEALATPRREVAERIMTIVRRTTRGFTDPARAVQVTKSIKALLKAAKPPNPNHLSLSALLGNASAIRIAAMNGSAKIRAFIRDSDRWRVNRWFAFFAVGYIIEEAENGSLQLGNNTRLLDLIADVFSQREWVQQGALFQLSQIVYFHIMNKYGNDQPRVLGIEQERPAYTVVDGDVPSNAKPYKRKIDIVLEGEAEGAERWVETKSLSGPFRKAWFKNTLIGKKKDDSSSRNHRGYFRQYFHDMRLNSSFMNIGNSGEILRGADWVGNNSYSWYFHDFAANRGRPPTATDINNAQKWLCKVPSTNPKPKVYYADNLSGSPQVIKGFCEGYANGRIQRRNTQSYITELLRPFAGPDQLNIEEFVNLIETFDP